MVVNNLHHRQIVPQSDLIVMDIVCRGDLEASRTEIHLHIVVLDNWYLSVNERNKYLLAVQAEMPFIVRIDADCRIRHNGFRTGGCYHEIIVGRIAVAVGDIILEMIEMTLRVTVYDLVIGYCGQSYRVPVDHSHSPVNHTLLVEMAEGGNNGLCELRLHREACALPVAGRAELAELLEYDSTVLLLPFPGIFQKLFPGDVFLADSLILETSYDLAFGGDGGVIRAGNPAGVLAVHPRLAYQHIVQRVVENVTHMKDAGHVRWRDYYSVWLAFVRFRVEAAMLLPPGIPFVLHFGGIVNLVQFHSPQI